MKGSITVDSQLNAGSIFTVRFPVLNSRILKIKIDIIEEPKLSRSPEKSPVCGSALSPLC